MDSIQAEFSFDAAHRLYDYPGKCAHIHGHTYKVIVSIGPDDISLDDISLAEGVCDKPFLMDFGSLKNLVKPLIVDWDHKLLLHKEDPGYVLMRQIDALSKGLVGLNFIPSAEHMARFLAAEISKNYMNTRCDTKLLKWESLFERNGNHIVRSHVKVTVTVYETPKHSASYTSYTRPNTVRHKEEKSNENK